MSLYSHVPSGGPYRLAQTTTTGTDGSYSFTVQPSTNEWYVAKLTFTPRVHSAQLFQGVQDVVSLTGPTHRDGRPAGAVHRQRDPGQVRARGLPAEADRRQHLEHRRGAPGDARASTFSFGWTFGAAGTKEFRARITGGPANVGGASSPVAVNVSLPGAVDAADQLIDRR